MKKINPGKKVFNMYAMWASCRCGHQDIHMRKPYLRVHDCWIIVTNWLWKTCFSTFDNTLCIYICWFQWFSKVDSHSMTYLSPHFCSSIITSYEIGYCSSTIRPRRIWCYWNILILNRISNKVDEMYQMENHLKPSRINVINSVLICKTIYENDRTALCSAPLCTHCTLSVHKAF